MRGSLLPMQATSLQVLQKRFRQTQRTTMDFARGGNVDSHPTVLLQLLKQLFGISPNNFTGSLNLAEEFLQQLPLLWRSLGHPSNETVKCF